MFHPDDFIKYLRGPELSALAAQVANALVAENGINIFGEVHEGTDGKAVLLNFSTTKDESDTHTALVIATAQMRAFKPIENTTKLRIYEPTQLQLDRALAEHAALLEKENKTLKAGNK